MDLSQLLLRAAGFKGRGCGSILPQFTFRAPNLLRAKPELFLSICLTPVCWNCHRTVHECKPVLLTLVFRVTSD